MNNRRILAGLSVAVLVCGAVPATADVVTEWNDITRQALAMAVPARPGPSGLLDFAAVHVAMHGAGRARLSGDPGAVRVVHRSDRRCGRFTCRRGCEGREGRAHRASSGGKRGYVRRG